MGTFAGHALPGTFFIVFSAWHLLQICRAYFASLRRGAPPYRSRTYFPCCGGIPIDAWLKVIFCFGGIAGEVVTGFKNGSFVHLGNAQHICMYGAFGVVGIAEILDSRRWRLPPKTLELAYFVAFGVEFVLFKFHLHGRSPLDVQLHQLLVYTIAATMATVLASMAWAESVTAVLARSILVLIQGLWFWQVAFILYPPPSWQAWDQNSHPQMMLATVLYIIHTSLSVGFTAILWFTTAVSNGGVRDPDPHVYLDGAGEEEERRGRYRPLSNGNSNPARKSPTKPPTVEDLSEEEIFA